MSTIVDFKAIPLDELMPVATIGEGSVLVYDNTQLTEYIFTLSIGPSEIQLKYSVLIDRYTKEILEESIIRKTD